jgi:hypothetical protein
MNNSAGQGGSGPNTIGIAVPAILAALLVLAMIIIAGLVVFVYKRRKRVPTNSSPVVYTNNEVTSLDNPVYVGSGSLDSKASNLHFDPRNVYGDEEGEHYMTVPGHKDMGASLNSLTCSTENLIQDGPPRYSTLQHT